MSGKFTRWGKRPEEPKARALVARATFEGPILASQVPALPFAQTRTFNRGASVEKRGVGVAARMITGKIPYNEVIQTADGYGELFSPGCFASSIAADDPRLLSNQNPEHVLGRKSAATCSFWEERDGLYFECNAPEASWANDLLTSMRRNDIDQASLVFWVMSYSWIESGGIKCRAITRATLLAASVDSFGGLGAAQAKTQQAIETARPEGYQAGRRASAATKPQARIATSARKVRTQIERKSNV